MELNQIISGIRSGDTLSLSKGITLVESQKSEDRYQSHQLIHALYNHRKKSIRLGITGIPGVGKSTFIENLGIHIVDSGLKVAVLAIDPSSSRGSGSILGDKTRMEDLIRNENAFIRPSPTGGTLGGVASRTRETMLLCEAAGYDVVIIETVGVGQSETEVINITDTFMMLAMPGTGDELQGIKRGIMESADIIVVNKADGPNVANAAKAKKQIEIALHLFPSAISGWGPKVLVASGIQNQGVKESWDAVLDRDQSITESGWIEENRKSQQFRAFQNLSQQAALDRLLQQVEEKVNVDEIRLEIENAQSNEFEAVLKLLDSI